MVEMIGYIAAAMGIVAWFPQAYKAWKTRETKDLSIGSLSMILLCMTLWLIYGIALVSWPLIGANVFSISLVLAILAAKLRFG